MAAGAYDGRVIGAHGTPSEKTGLNFIPSVVEAAPGARIAYSGHDLLIDWAGPVAGRLRARRWHDGGIFSSRGACGGHAQDPCSAHESDSIC